MMKKRLSFSNLLHKDKLMMLISLILAIVIWALVVYGKDETQPRTISRVPVSITLTPFASDELKLRIIDGVDAYATVVVRGKRSVINKLTAQDITVVADTSSVLQDGEHDLPLRVTSSGDYDIVSVTGEDGSSRMVTITCDMWGERSFEFTSEEVEMPNLTLADSENMTFGSPSPSGDAIKDGVITVSGPKSYTNRIDRIVAVIHDEKKISETTSFTAELIAYDAHNMPVDSISFLNANDGKVNVVVPVMKYYKENVSLNVLNAPSGLKDKVSVAPSTIELWAIPTELEEFLSSIRQELTIDFDQLLAERKDITRSIELKKSGSVRPFTTSDVLHITMDFASLTNDKVSIPLSKENVTVLNLPDGYAAELEQSVLPNVVLCGTRSMLREIDPSQLRVVVDAADLALGHHTLKARIEVGDDNMWTYYGEEGYEIQIGITKVPVDIPVVASDALPTEN